MSLPPPTPSPPRPVDSTVFASCSFSLFLLPLYIFPFACMYVSYQQYQSLILLVCPFAWLSVFVSVFLSASRFCLFSFRLLACRSGGPGIPFLTNVFFCLSVCLLACLSVCLCLCVSTCFNRGKVFLTKGRSAGPGIRFLTNILVRLCACLPACLPVCQPVSMFACLMIEPGQFVG